MTNNRTKYLREVTKKYGGKFIGTFERGGTLLFMDVFYQENPNKTKGHSHYFGLYKNLADDLLYICNAHQAASETYPAIELPNGEFLVSRGQHDYVTHGDMMLDGGPAYFRYNPAYPPTHTMTIVDGKEVFTEISVDKPD